MDIFEILADVDNASVPAAKKPVKDKQRYLAKIRQGLNLELFKGLALEPKFGIPVVKAYNGPLPNVWKPFCNRAHVLNVGIHFFSADYSFNAILSSPGKYVDRLKQYGVIIAPDYSQYYKFLYK